MIWESNLNIIQTIQEDTMPITDMPNLVHDVVENAECKFHNIPDKFYAQIPATEPKKLTIKIPRTDDNCYDHSTRHEVLEPVLEPEIPNLFGDSDYKFGIVNLKLNEVPITSRKQLLHFTCDMSGSMEDVCLDGRTKMQHSVHTIKNILRMSADAEDAEIWIQINGFDDKIERVIPATQISNDNIEELIKMLKKLYPRRSTNIELGLKTANDDINKFQIEHVIDNFEVTHVFLTDGNATAGSTDNDKLTKQVDDSYNNVFIGFGTDHSAETLLALSSKRGGNYYVVDKIENCGLVFGDIIHRVLYKSITDINIAVTFGEVYNYETNEWSSQFEIDSLTGEADKTYHLRAKIVDDVEIEITAKISSDVSSSLPVTIANITPNDPSVDIDLSQYIFRQRTREILYDAIQRQKFIGLNRKNARNHMNTHLKQMKRFMSKYDLIEDEKYKLMCDDIVITMRTIGTEYGTMFIAARQRSNGRETSYNVNEIPQSYNQHSVPLRRAHAFNGLVNPLTQDIDLGEDYDDDDHSRFHELSRVPLNRSQTTATCVKLMRAASSGVESTQQYFEDYDEFDKDLIDKGAIDKSEIDKDAIEKEVQDQFNLDYPLNMSMSRLPLTRQNAWTENDSLVRKESASGSSEASV